MAKLAEEAEAEGEGGEGDAAGGGQVVAAENMTDAEAARRVTAACARLNPGDPLKYDFCITRLGMGVRENQ